mmetsp:Transcript_26546/g.53897  ORF Transcript_26546/g.53897 Transcript_26546/m.53897 type:complete len:332 (+) Transcript_26546:2401-3396(+)
MMFYLRCITYLILLVLTLPPIDGLLEPSIRWSRRLNGCGTLSDASPRKGNGVVASQSGQHVWITDDEGTLHILDATNSTSDEILFKPPAVETKRIESRSSVTLSQNETGVDYAVYAVVDVSTSDDPTDDSMTSSRIIAVYGGGGLLGELKWNATVKGIVTGTPQIGSGGNTTTIYVTHNVNNRGYLSVFSNEGNKTTLISSDKPFGPVTVFTFGGKDELYWGESGDSGYSDSGRVYQIAPSAWLTNSSTNDITTSTIVPPVIWRGERKRSRIWLGGKSSTIHGWTDGRPLSDVPTWSKQLGKSLRNESFRKFDCRASFSSHYLQAMYSFPC